ncbi:hypothetical protein Tco_1125809, partial [Tanacetum coccineum]
AIYRTEVCIEIKDYLYEKKLHEPLAEAKPTVENMVKDRIMDSGVSFHTTYCKEELERFKLRSGKVRLVDGKTLDIAGVGDVVLKTSFGTSWTLKDVRYIPILKRRLISFGQLDKEGYYVGFRDQQWWFREAEESFLHNVSEDKRTIEFGVVERLSRTFRAESTRIRVEDPKMLWADSVSMVYLIYRIPYILIGLRIPEEEWQGKDTSLAHLKATAQMKCYKAFGIRRVTRLSEAEISHLWTRFIEPIGALRTVEDQMKNSLKMKHPLRREVLRLHRYEDLLESPGL